MVRSRIGDGRSHTWSVERYQTPHFEQRASWPGSVWRVHTSAIGSPVAELAIGASRRILILGIDRRSVVSVGKPPDRNWWLSKSAALSDVSTREAAMRADGQEVTSVVRGSAIARPRARW